MLEVSGSLIGICEISILIVLSSTLRKNTPTLKEINIVSYLWFMATILTFIWEFFYIVNYTATSIYAQRLYNSSEHTWTNHYDLSYILPWKLSRIFYAEYAVYADREYCSFTDDWSKTVESSHAIFCGLFSLGAVLSKIYKKEKSYLVLSSIAMGSQLMNSILYLVEYEIQTQDKNSINFNSESFPTGVLLSKRPFMWINILWIVLPFFSMFSLLCSKQNVVNKDQRN